MLKSFLNKLAGKPNPATPAPVPVPEPVEENHEPLFQTLAMTDDMRDALFPKTPQMISAVFDRSEQRPGPPPSDPPPRAYDRRAPEDHAFPIV